MARARYLNVQPEAGHKPERLDAVKDGLDRRNAANKRAGFTPKGRASLREKAGRVARTKAIKAAQEHAADLLHSGGIHPALKGEVDLGPVGNHIVGENAQQWGSDDPRRWPRFARRKCLSRLRAADAEGRIMGALRGHFAK